MARQRAARPSVKRPGRPRVAVLAPYLSDEYEWTIWRSVRQAIEAHGGSAVCIAGAAREDPVPERSARGALYELVAPGAFDGIVCVSSVVGHFVGVNATETWLGTRGIPAVAVGHGERLPHVLVDAATGMNQLLHHLIAHHGHRRIAFISGPPTSPEADPRSAAYERTLQKHELAVDRRLMLEGDFTQASGVRAVVELFDRRQLRAGDVDAIVAANDDMALGAIEALKARNLSNVVVIGFDALPEALGAVRDGSLTATVEQFPGGQSRGAVQALVGFLRDGKKPEALTLLTPVAITKENLDKAERIGELK
jgi:DNA-binding LacI/PurR family transcriptional regulator